jgi:hypothetical protein
MLEREDFEDLWEMMPGIKPCTVFQRLADSELGPAITVTASEKRPMDTKTMTMLGVVESEMDFCTFHLWVSTFSTPALVGKHWIIQEQSGRQWVVMMSRLEMQETRYRCDCIENMR